MYASPLILASGSPRRRELLRGMGLEFVCESADVDESTDLPAGLAVEELAIRKAKAVAAGKKEGTVIGSDTLVSLEGKALGKPADPEDAKAMLRLLSGREHDVFTGVCVIDAASGRMLSGTARTGVNFRALTEEEIAAYVETGEPMDKAGAYAIQGGAGRFVTGLDGAYDNVMGFPTALAAELLDRLGGED